MTRCSHSAPSGNSAQSCQHLLICYHCGVQKGRASTRRYCKSGCRFYRIVKADLSPLDERAASILVLADLRGYRVGRAHRMCEPSPHDGGMAQPPFAGPAWGIAGILHVRLSVHLSLLTAPPAASEPNQSLTHHSMKPWNQEPRPNANPTASAH